MIEFKNVYKIYHMGDSEVRAIDGISFTIDKGELLVSRAPANQHA